ncbi:MAG: Gfo/Idh/MocA family oxidoreductase, partial [Armatimonadetes bacterium]|nr:Gfo/Idh/MocA family oxidoreductase [Armatimonadota bacterium]
MSDKVRLAIVGTGGIAKAHLGGYKTLLDAGYDQFEIAGLCDTNEGRRSEYAALVKEYFGLEPAQYSSVEEMCEKAGDIQAADICTPHAFHHTAAIPCLEAGIDVMVEKPCGITIKASDRIIEAAQKKNCIVAVAEQVRRGLKARCMDWAVNEQKMIGD